MRRTILVALAAAALSLPAVAQERVWRLGILMPGTVGGHFPGSLRGTALPFLAERGFVEGRNLIVFPGEAEGDARRLPELARALARERIDAVITVGTPAASAMMAAAPDMPIVMSFAGEDPVEVGHARSFARPGGKVTGVFFRAVEADIKRFELLAEAMPQARHLGFIFSPTVDPARAELIARAAARLGAALTSYKVESPADYPHVFAAFKTAGAAGVLVQATTVFGRHAPIFSPIAAQHGIATMCEWDFMAHDGCVFGFGPDLVALRRLTAEYVVRIFNGADPGELPIETPDRFTLAVNLRAAADIGLQLSPIFLARADEVIE